MKKNWIFLASLIIASLAIAQDVEENIKVRLVELDVKVTDWQQHYIGGLDRSDFRVFENGTQKTIDSFQEMTLTDLPADEQVNYQPRVMVVLDYKNNDFWRMRRVFPVLREYANTRFDSKIQMGLAFNGNGIVELQPFTDSREKFMAALDQAEAEYAKSPYRILKALERNIVLPSPVITNGIGEKNPAFPRPDRVFFEPLKSSRQGDLIDSSNNPAYQRINNTMAGLYLFSELGALNQFVNYLSAYEGKKSLVMISELWDRAIDQDDLSEVVTSCVEHKISINVLSLAKSFDMSVNPAQIGADTRDLGVAEDSGLSSNTAGFSTQVFAGSIGNMLDAVVQHQIHYYRIRYYSDVEGKEYRHIKVKVNGTFKDVSTFSGFNAKNRKLSASSTGAEFKPSTLENADLNLTMNTDWMTWEWSSLGKRTAYYAIGQHAYNSEGQLIGENVDAGQLMMRKFDGAFEEVTLIKDYDITLANPAEIARLVFTVVDLTSGKTVEVIRE